MTGLMLDDLLRAIADAVMSAQRFLATRHHDLSHLFRPSRTSPGSLEPHTLSLVLPKGVVRDDEAKEGIHDVPAATLVPHQSTALDTLSLTFPCLLEGLEEGGTAGAKRVSIVLGRALPNQHSGLATMTITFRTGDPPEGMARINDQMLKKF
jgi:hypothetical protein